MYPKELFCLVAMGYSLCLLMIILLKHIQSGISLVTCIMGSVLYGSFFPQIPIAFCNNM